MFENLPTGPYATLVVDPPWNYNDKLGGGNTGFGESKARQKTGMYPGVRSAANHYGTLTTGEIATLPVADLAAPDAHLYIWTTNAFMEDAYRLMAAWDFTPKTIVTWVKTKKGVGEPEAPGDCAFGMGFYYRNMTEHVLFGVRGSLKPLSHSERNVVFAPRLAHSAKPDEFYALARRLSPGPRVDLFARKPREGFEVWGDEAPTEPVAPSAAAGYHAS